MKNRVLMHFRVMTFIVGLVIIISSCDKDWFDVKSDKRLAVLTSLNDFELLLDNFGVMNANSPALGEIASNGHYMPETRWLTLSNANANGVQKNAYSWSKSFPNVEVRDWNLGYEIIFHCNLVLDGLNKIRVSIDSEQQQFDLIRGNALFHRAKLYYDLAQIYAEPFDSATAKTDLGIPLKDGIDITEGSIRHTVFETYSKIINDLTEAAKLLPAIAKFASRGSKASAYGLLARTFLVIGDFERANRYADSTLAIYNSLIDYNTIPATANNIGRLNKETIFFSTMVNWPFVSSSGYIYIDTALFNLYDKNDLRKSRFFRQTSAGIVFKGNYNVNTIPFSGIATDEIFLIRAECRARIGDYLAALEDLNQVVKMRWDSTKPYSAITAAGPEEALAIILTERKRELLLRGLHWTDLRRLNKDERYKITLERKIADQTYKLEPNSYRYTFPIPDDVLSLSKISQTPGW